MCTACACGTADDTSERSETGGRVYQVAGMTCGHCVSSVSTEIGEIAGVSDVRVDLATGTVTVAGAGFSDEEVHAAVERAGYTPSGASPAVAS
ncbi:cation transporter [Streptosporangium sp. NPDC023615]|uniref:heavy-metal-associated domain-containing protein n=1 Tax=Streptosporangium sp. NPDC023615 TaxID=3154794 RepID=UPI00341D208A